MIKKIECRNVIQKKINRMFWNIRNGCRIEKNKKIINEKLMDLGCKKKCRNQKNIKLG